MARAERSKKYKGVTAFSYGGWATVTRIDGVDSIIYTSDSEEECASAYNEYIKKVGAKHWERNTNPVEHCHDIYTLWLAVRLVGSVGARRHANEVINMIKEYEQQAEGGK